MDDVETPTLPTPTTAPDPRDTPLERFFQICGVLTLVVLLVAAVIFGFWLLVGALFLLTGGTVVAGGLGTLLRWSAY